MCNSSSVSCACGSIPSGPQTPVDPLSTRCTVASSAPATPRYFSAILTSGGPTSGCSTAWQLKQSLAFISARPGSVSPTFPSADLQEALTSVRTLMASPLDGGIAVLRVA
jgi:hypothetical protein